MSGHRGSMRKARGGDSMARAAVDDANRMMNRARAKAERYWEALDFIAKFSGSHEEAKRMAEVALDSNRRFESFAKDWAVIGESRGGKEGSDA